MDGHFPSWYYIYIYYNLGHCLEYVTLRFKLLYMYQPYLYDRFFQFSFLYSCCLISLSYLIYSHEEDHPLQLHCGVFAWQIPPDVLNGCCWLCLLMEKCNGVCAQILGNELTLSPALTLKQDYSITLDSMSFLHKHFPIVLGNVITYIMIKKPTYFRWKGQLDIKTQPLDR